MTPRLGLVLPQVEIGADPGDLLAVAEATQESGFDYLECFDHVLGADVTQRPDWRWRYTAEHPFHEPLTMLAFLAGRTTLELATGVLVLPQRQTALVAKQAAEVDILTGGRLLLGVAIGWNAVEYEALGATFQDRAVRFEEQIHLLRALWTHEVVDFAGRYHRVTRAGINPLPVQRPIPLWFGGHTSGPVLRRIGRLADGWVCNTGLGADLDAALEVMRAAASTVGRNPSEVGLQGRVRVGSTVDTQRIRDELAAWTRRGATRVSLSGLGCGRTPTEHVALVRALGEVISAVPESPQAG